MKLWDKGAKLDDRIAEFTTGKDREMDLRLAKWDIIGSLAHIRMLEKTGLLEAAERRALSSELARILEEEVKQGLFTIQEGVEDVHSQVEMLLTQKLGDAGKKIHSGRSRNDQVLVDLRMFLRDEMWQLSQRVLSLFRILQARSEETKNVLIPGYTHLQVAMPSSFGLWFGAYAESLIEDMEVIGAAYRVADNNPLGSAAGYGSSFPLDRTMTTKLLGFSDLSWNVVHAQMGRGRTERLVAFALSSVAATVGRMAMDICLYNSQNFGFLRLPQEYTTGSSIMPHKKNPDVFEIIRGKCNLLQGLPGTVGNLLTNLPSGYHREMQLLKEQVFPALDDLKSVLELTENAISRLEVENSVISDEKYDLLFTVERVNELVLKGIPFREAYKQVGQEVENGTFTPIRLIAHTHEGSIGNLCNDKIAEKMIRVHSTIPHKKTEEALTALLSEARG